MISEDTSRCEERPERPLVVDIKRHSLEDGPGIRSVVFFKGCPLRCVFCHSPETQSPDPEIAFSPSDCIACGACAASCPQKVVDLDYNGRIHREGCDTCGACAGVCPGMGLRLIGKYHEAQALAEILMRDIAFYRHSGGGVTVSGGECTLYPEYLESLLRLLKAEKVHITVETSGYFDAATFCGKILPYTDLILYDVKIVDPVLHRQITGKDNLRIINNLRTLVGEKRVEVHPRVPLVPGITATPENLSAVVDLLCDIGAESVTLLPYNPLGIAMYECLGRPKPVLPEHFMSPEEEREVRIMFKNLIAGKKDAGLVVRAG
jgi:pyruvate formate lyase activating enzyme